MFGDSLMSDLLGMKAAVQGLEIQRQQMYMHLLNATTLYNTAVENNYGGADHTQNAQLAVLFTQVQCYTNNYELLRQQLATQLNLNYESLVMNVRAISKKEFLPQEVRLQNLLLMGVNLLEFRRQWYVAMQIYDPMSPDMQQAQLDLQPLLTASYTELLPYPTKVERFVSAIFWLQEFSLLDIITDAGLICYGSSVIESICQRIRGNSAWLPVYTQLQKIITAPQVIKSEEQKVIAKIDAVKLTPEPEVKPTPMPISTVIEPVATAQPTVTSVPGISEPEVVEWTEVRRRKNKKQPHTTKNESVVEAQPDVTVTPVIQPIPAPVAAAVKVQTVSEAKIVEVKIKNPEPVILKAPKKSMSEPPVVKNPATIIRAEIQQTIKQMDPNAINNLLNQHLNRHEFIYAQIKEQLVERGVTPERSFFKTLDLPSDLSLRLVLEAQLLPEHKLLLLRKTINMRPDEFYKYSKAVGLGATINAALAELDLAIAQNRDIAEFKVEFDKAQAESVAWYNNQKASIFAALSNAKTGKNIELSAISLIIDDVNEMRQTPLMIAIVKKMHFKTICSLIERNESALWLRDCNGRNCLDYWAMYDAANLDYVQLMWNRMLNAVDLKGNQRQVLKTLYDSCEQDGNSWLHLLILHNNSEDIVCAALDKIATFNKRDLLYAAAYTKNKLRQTPVYLIESKQEYWPKVSDRIYTVITQSVYWLSSTFTKSGPPFFSEDSTFFSVRKADKSGDCVADPVFLDLNLNNIIRITQIVARRYTLRHSIIKGFARVHGTMRDPNKHSVEQLKVIRYFDCAPEKMELVQVISEEHTLYGYIMQQICAAKDSGIEKLAKIPVFEYVGNILPLAENLAWKKIKEYCKGTKDINITDDDITFVKKRINKSTRMNAAIYIGSSQTTGAREFLPIELAIMDNSFELVKYLCENCDGAVTDDILLFGLWCSGATFGEIQEYLFTRHPIGKFATVQKIMAQTIYLQEASSNINVDKVLWLMNHGIYPTAINAKGDNLLHACIHLVAENKVDVSHLINFVRVITVNQEIIAFLMGYENSSGKTFMDLLQDYNKAKKISDSDMEAIQCGIYAIRMKVEEVVMKAQSKQVLKM